MADELLAETLSKIDQGNITVEDFNRLIKETTPASIIDRIRRRTLRNVSKSHIDKKSGHQPLSLPNLAKRVAPKRKPVHQQNHGRSKIAHDHSTRTQRQKSVQEAILYVKNNIGKPINECDYSSLDKSTLAKVANRMASLKNINRDWLLQLVKQIDNG
jgi:hypothetical protein